MRGINTYVADVEYCWEDRFNYEILRLREGKSKVTQLHSFIVIFDMA